MSTVRIDKLLSNLGYCSRREVQYLIKDEMLREGEDLIRKSDQKVDPALVTLDNEALDPGQGLSLVLHKPVGFVCSHKDKGRLIYELFPDRFSRRKPPLSSVGRLDKDTSGLLILTDDGDLNHRLTAPNKNVGKVYQVTIDKDLKGNEADIFASGILTLDGDDEPLKPAHWEPTGKNEGFLTIYEGRYHQVRRMFETTGAHVVKLHRTRIGAFILDSLEEGEWRTLTEKDIELLFTQKD